MFARHGIGPLDDWDAARGARPAAALVRRRPRHDGRAARVGVGPRRPRPDARRLPDRVEQAARAAARGDWPPEGDVPDPAECAAVLGGTEDDWLRLLETWGDAFARAPRRGRRPAAEPAHPDARRHRGRLRADDPPLVGAGARGDGRAGARRPPDVLRLLQPALDGQPPLGHRRGGARTRSSAWVEAARPRRPARRSSPRFREGRTEGSWENFLYFSARDYFEAQPARRPRSSGAEEERAVGLTHISSRTALRVSAQVIALDRLDPRVAGPAAGRRRRRRSSRARRR